VLTVFLPAEPTLEEVQEQMARRPSTADVKAMAARRKSLNNRQVTGASQITLKQSIVPIVLVTILFFLWGFAYGLLDVLNSHFQQTLGVTKAQGAGLSGAYFGAYFLAPLTYAGWVVRRFGYRWTFIMGLVIYGIGALMFWPSGVKRSFGGFVGSMFIVGSGLSTLETAANPYIATCGPPRYSEIRLELSQSFQAIGSVVAPLLAARVFFAHVGSQDLTSVQWTYLGIAGFVFILAIVFYFAPIPEISDADMADGEEQGRLNDTGYVDKPLYKQYILFWGVAAQFCYVGAQVAIANFFINYVLDVRASTDTAAASNLLAMAQGLFAIGRFSAAGLMKFVRPRLVLWIYMSMIIVFIAAAIGATGNGGIATLSLVLFFESCIFPTIFTLSLRGLGRHTKRGASFLVASVCGGAVFPPVTGAVADAIGTQHALIIPLIGFVIAW
jgi:FHS family L-fucose permease-like MFS transporter